MAPWLIITGSGLDDWIYWHLLVQSGTRGSVVGWGTMLQAGRSRVRVPMRWIFFNCPNSSSCTMALGSTQPLIEMSTRNLSGGGGEGRPARKADNLTAIWEPIVQKMWEPRPLITLWAFTDCYRDSSSCTISPNHNQLQDLTINECLRLAPFSFSFSSSLCLSLSFSYWLDYWTELSASELYSLITTVHGPHGKHSLYCWQSLFTASLPSNRSPSAPPVRFCGNVFSDPLLGNGHGADHIENTSCNTFSIAACAYSGCCLEMGPHITIPIET
jgi:hypothetical protein